MYRLSDHNLEIEKGRHKKHWRPREERICNQCSSGQIETEQHFLSSCNRYKDLRENYLNSVKTYIPSFEEKMIKTEDLLRVCLGETPECVELSAKYVYSCHKRREQSDTPP